ncbi:MAG TPA: DUF481 domain-containing protein [Pyrinomonadaceae bacterium]|nr:DUF481 domain-containing protein [Pyrinomonadaceae bacterium]
MFSKFFTFVLFALTVTGGAIAQQPPDAKTVTCTLRNGDRLSGREAVIEEGALSIETPYLGRATLPAAALAACETANAELQVKVNELINSTPAVTTAQASEPPPPAAAEVPKPTPAPPAKSAPEDEWKKTIAFSYAFARGNSDVSDMNIAGAIEHKERDGRFVLQGFLRRGTRNGQALADLFTSTARYERKFSGEVLSVENVSFFNEVGYEQDALKKLDHRMVWNGGMQFPLAKSESNEMALDVGGGVTREDYATDVRRTLGSGLLRFKSEQTILGRTKIFQQVAAFPDFAEVGRYRLQADLSLTAPITKIFSVRVGALNRFDNRPQEAVKRNDFSLSSGLAFSF